MELEGGERRETTRSNFHDFLRYRSAHSLCLDRFPVRTVRRNISSKLCLLGLIIDAGAGCGMLLVLANVCSVHLRFAPATIVIFWKTRSRQNHNIRGSWIARSDDWLSVRDLVGSKGYCRVVRSRRQRAGLHVRYGCLSKISMARLPPEATALMLG